MAQKENFYTTNLYKSGGINPFIDHIREYFNNQRMVYGPRKVPVSRTKSDNSYPVFFTFSNQLLKKFLEQTYSIKKPYEVALNYGFRGNNIGESNGIFLIADDESRLIEAVNSLVVQQFVKNAQKRNKGYRNR